MPLPLHINTPLIESDEGYSSLRTPILFKMDALQPSGSFKIRGIGMLAQMEVENGAASLVCASGGNAGFAATYAGHKLGTPVTIVVPETTLPDVREAIERRGAKVIVHGAAFDDADAFAREFAKREGAAYIHPFDDPRLWDGHASLVDEVVQCGVTFDGIVVSVGGGGLMAGVVRGLRRNGLGHIPVVAVETAGAASFNKSIAGGLLATLPRIETIATSLGARRVAPYPLELAKTHRIISLTVSDPEAVSACLRFADWQRVLVEPACGAALAALDAHQSVMSAFRRPLVVVCGGIGTSISKLIGWKHQFGL